jgi:uncharacterized protein YfdQ (DUF2303 family)
MADTTNVNTYSDARSIIEFARERTEAKLVAVEATGPGVPHTFPAVFDRSGSLVSVRRLVDEWRERPARRSGRIVAHDIASFVALVNRDSGENSVIFADAGERPKLVAVLNFHAAGHGGEPAFCDDVIEYPFPLSDEWEAWVGSNGEAKKKGQAAFAEFIEDRLFDIGEPGAAGNIAKAWAEKLGVSLAGPNALMQVPKGLSVRVEETVRNVINRGTGEVSFVFTTEHKDGDGLNDTVKVPSAFHIRIPILRGEVTYSIPVRLRYRAGGGKISWFYEMHRPELFLLDAVNDAIARVRAPEDAVDVASRGCGLLVVMGLPPGMG